MKRAKKREPRERERQRSEDYGIQNNCAIKNKALEGLQVYEEEHNNSKEVAKKGA